MKSVRKRDMNDATKYVRCYVRKNAVSCVECKENNCEKLSVKYGKKKWSTIVLRVKKKEFMLMKMMMVPTDLVFWISFSF